MITISLLVFWLALASIVVCFVCYVIRGLDGWFCISDLRKHGRPARKMTDDEVELISTLIQPISLANEERARSIRPVSNEIYLVNGQLKGMNKLTSEGFFSCTLGKYPIKLHSAFWPYVLESNTAEVALSKKSATVFLLNGHGIKEAVSSLGEHNAELLSSSANECCAKWDLVNFLTIGMYLCLALTVLGVDYFISSFFGVRLLPGWGLGLLLFIVITLFFSLILGMRDRKVNVNLSDDGVQYIDEAPGFLRNELLSLSKVKSIRICRRLLFKTLVIDMADSNQRYFLCNVSVGKKFLEKLENFSQISNSDSDRPTV